MPSTRIPTSITTGPGAPPPGGAQADDVAASLVAHITDPVGAHAATAISYAGGPNWYDGVTNPASDVETQLDKTISDLAATQGYQKIGTEISPAWHDGSTIAAGSIRDHIEGIIEGLADDTGVAGSLLVGYKGGASWAGGSGAANPATSVEGQLDKILSDLSSQADPSGGTRIGLHARSSWLDGSTNLAMPVWNAIEDIVFDLSRQIAAVDGVSKIGAYQATSTGSFGTVATGTARSQITNLINNAGHLSNGNTWSGTQTFSSVAIFQSGITLNTQDPFVIASPADIDVNWNMNQGDWILSLAGSTSDNFQITDGTDNVFKVYKDVLANEHVVRFGSDGAGIADGYSDSALQFRGEDPSSLQARALEITPGSGAGVGAPLVLRVGGTDNAGDMPGALIINFMVNEGNGGRRVYLPTQTYALQDSGPAQTLFTAGGGTYFMTRGTLNNSSVIIEAYIFGLGWNAGSPINNISWAAKRRCMGQRDNSGTYSVLSAVQDVFTHDNTGFSTPPSATIVANASGFHIQVTPGADVSPTDQLWWGYLVISPFEFYDNPDVDYT